MATFRGTIPDFQLANPLYTAAQVSFFTVDEDGEKTSTLATLYAAPTGTQTAANPQTLDSEGKFLRPVYTEVPVIAECVGPNVASHTTGVIAARGTWRAEWETATRYYVNDTLSDPDNPYTIYIAAFDFTSGATFAADRTAGKVELRVKGGDRYYFTIDLPLDAKPRAGERFKQRISEASVLLAGMPNSHGHSEANAVGSPVYSVEKNRVPVGTMTIIAGTKVAVLAAASDVSFAEDDEISLLCPNPQDAGVVGLTVTIRLDRVPA